MSDLRPADLAQTLSESQRLFMALAEELKLPLQQIARQAELANLDKSDNSLAIGSVATGALGLLDNYLLCMRLQQDPELEFAKQPVSIAAALYDTRAKLQATAADYNVRLELDIAGKYGPVLAHRQALMSALTSLGYSLISSLPASGSSKKQRLCLSAYRTPKSVVAGIYGDGDLLLNSEAFSLGKQLYGRAHQPLTSVSPHASSGIFIADTILRAMSSGLKASKHNNQSGLAVTLPLSPQLQLL